MNESVKWIVENGKMVGTFWQVCSIFSDDILYSKIVLKVFKIKSMFLYLK